MSYSDFFLNITIVYTIALLFLILSLEIMFVNSRLSVNEIPSLRKRIPSFMIYATVFRRIFINFFLNLLVNLFLSVTLILIFNSFPNDIYKESKATFVLLFIVFNLIGLWVITKLYERTSFGKITTNFLNLLINLRIVRWISKKVIAIFDYISVFFQTLTKTNKKEKEDSIRELINDYEEPDIKLLIPNYFEPNHNVLNSKEELERMVVLLDSIVLALTATGLLLTSSLFSNEVSTGSQYLFIMFFVSVIITKIRANHERVLTRNSLSSFEDAS